MRFQVFSVAKDYGEMTTHVKRGYIRELAKKEGVDLLIGALKNAIRGVGPTLVGEIFDRYFDGGTRRPGTAISVS